MKDHFFPGSCFEFHSYYFCLIPPKSGTESEYIATKTYNEFNSALYHPILQDSSTGLYKSAFISASKQCTIICKLFRLAEDSWWVWQTAAPGNIAGELHSHHICTAKTGCLLGFYSLCCVCLQNTTYLFWCRPLCAALKHLNQIAVPVQVSVFHSRALNTAVFNFCAPISFIESNLKYTPTLFLCIEKAD